MGTRSRIGVMHGDNCKSIYVHWDGYPSGVGRTLFENYNSSKANFLIALGNVSSLEPNIEIPEGVDHSFENPAENITVFYGRDRGETGNEFQTDFTFEEFIDRSNDCGAEYYYIMRDGEWFVGDTYCAPESKMSGKLLPLAEVLADIDIETVEEN